MSNKLIHLEFLETLEKAINLGKLIGVATEELSMEELYRRFKKVVEDEQ